MICGLFGLLKSDTGAIDAGNQVARGVVAVVIHGEIRPGDACEVKELQELRLNGARRQQAKAKARWHPWKGNQPAVMQPEKWLCGHEEVKWQAHVRGWSATRFPGYQRARRLPRSREYPPIRAILHKPRQIANKRCEHAYDYTEEWRPDHPGSPPDRQLPGPLIKNAKVIHKLPLLLVGASENLSRLDKACPEA